jgi:peptidoglycan lytic transglycosylase
MILTGKEMIIRCIAFILTVSLFMSSSCASARYESDTKPHYAVASWYGPDFHGKPTASGKIFDMNAFTCAHREYPFGTLLKITYLSNDKTTNCLVNDRGPFVDGRDVDLSYAAARDLGLIPAGTGAVRIEFVGRDNSYIRQVRDISNTGPVTIQVGSFKEFANANRLKMSLDLKYDKAYIAEADINGNRYYRVRIGTFRIRGDALRLAKVLADEGYEALITNYEEKL